MISSSPRFSVLNHWSTIPHRWEIDLTPPEAFDVFGYGTSCCRNGGVLFLLPVEHFHPDSSQLLLDEKVKVVSVSSILVAPLESERAEVLGESTDSEARAVSEFVQFRIVELRN